MKTITIRLEDGIHKALKYKTIYECETTIQDHVVGLIKKDLGIKDEKEGSK